MALIELVYGIIEDPAGALARVRAAPATTLALGPMSARIDADTPAFRLNSPGWNNLPPEVVQRLSGTEALLDYCQERLCNRVSVFSLRIRSFLGDYLDFARSEVERQHERLHRQVLASGLPVDLGFPSYSDWVFSAPLPLPNTYIAIGDGSGEDRFARTDIFFWNGTSALAVVFEGRNMKTPRERQAMSRLKAAHPDINILSVPCPAPEKPWSFTFGLVEHFGGGFLPAHGLPFGPYRVLAQDARGDCNAR